jgi:hypothetical protein
MLLSSWSRMRLASRTGSRSDFSEVKRSPPSSAPGPGSNSQPRTGFREKGSSPGESGDSIRTASPLEAYDSVSCGLNADFRRLVPKREVGQTRRSGASVCVTERTDGPRDDQCSLINLLVLSGGRRAEGVSLCAA